MRAEDFAGSASFASVDTPIPGDLIYFLSGPVPYEISRGVNRVFPSHIGIVLDSDHWIGAQTSTGVAVVSMSNSWWKDRKKISLRFKLVSR